MSEIGVNSNVLKNIVQPLLNAGSSDLSSASSSILSMDIPDDFLCNYQLRNIPNEINCIIAELNNTNSWISSVIYKFDNAQIQNENVLKSLWDTLSGGIIRTETGSVNRVLSGNNVDSIGDAESVGSETDVSITNMLGALKKNILEMSEEDFENFNYLRYPKCGYIQNSDNNKNSMLHGWYVNGDLVHRIVYQSCINGWGGECNKAASLNIISAYAPDVDLKTLINTISTSRDRFYT